MLKHLSISASRKLAIARKASFLPAFSPKLESTGREDLMMMAPESGAEAHEAPANAPDVVVGRTERRLVPSFVERSLALLFLRRASNAGASRKVVVALLLSFIFY